MNFKKFNFKGNNKIDNPFAAQDKRNFLEYIADNKKIVMPLILVLAVALTIIIALNANKKENEGKIQEDVVTSVNEDGSYVVPEVDLEKNAYEDVNTLMKTYFDAYAAGDMDTIKSIYVGLEATEELRLQEVSEYISGIPTIDVYTKPGPVDGSYVVYAYTEVLFEGYDIAMPGMQTMYVCTDENGKLFINGDVVDDRVTDYISNISLQADVKDLNNEVAVSYNDIIAENKELADFLSDMSAKIQVSVGEALAAIESGEAPVTDEAVAEASETPAEASEAPAEGEEAAPAEDAAEATSGEDGQEADAAAEAGSVEEAAPVKKTIKATDVINIRSSDSETADKVGKTSIGEEFTQLEELANGWSKIEYQDGVAYVKTMYFEEVTEDTEDTADAATEGGSGTADTEETDNAADTASSTNDSTSDSASSKVDSNAKGKMQVSDTVRLRKSQSTDSNDNIITNIYKNEIINVIEQYANGWAKVEYDGKTGYIKTEFLKMD